MDGERRGDWEKGVDENLAMLNSAQRTTDKELDEHDLLIARHERILVGDPEEGKIGMSAECEMLGNKVNELRAEIGAIRSTLFGDHAGGPGHEQRLEKLEDKKVSAERRAERREGYFWHFISAVALQACTLAVIAILNWERIEFFAEKVWSRMHHGAAATVPAKTHKGKHGRKKRLPPIVLPEAKDDESSATDVP